MHPDSPMSSHQHKLYHSGRISIGVAKGLAGSPIDWVSTIPNANEIDIVPKIQTGNMYRMSFGQAGSPYKLCPQPLENEAISSVSRCQGNLAMILLNDEQDAMKLYSLPPEVLELARLS